MFEDERVDIDSCSVVQSIKSSSYMEDLIRFKRNRSRIKQFGPSSLPCHSIMAYLSLLVPIKIKL